MSDTQSSPAVKILNNLWFKVGNYAQISYWLCKIFVPKQRSKSILGKHWKSHFKTFFVFNSHNACFMFNLFSPCMFGTLRFVRLPVREETHVECSEQGTRTLPEIFIPWCLRTLLSYLQQCTQFSQSPLETSTLVGLLFLRDWLCQLVMWLLEVYSILIFLFFIKYFMEIKNWFSEI